MEIYFKEPRLDLSHGGELFVRFAARLGYVLLIALAVVMFFSDLEALRWTSIIFSLFLLDRRMHIDQGEIRLRYLKGEKTNIALALIPRAYAFLNTAFRKSLMTGEDFSLLLLSLLANERDVKEALKRLDVLPKEFSAKAALALQEPAPPKNREETITLIESVAKDAYKVARETNEKFIHSRNLFLGLYNQKRPAVSRIFSLFELRAGDLKEALLFGRYAKSMAGIRRGAAHLGGIGRAAG